MSPDHRIPFIIPGETSLFPLLDRKVIQNTYCTYALNIRALKTPLFGMKMRNKTSRHDLIVYSFPRSTEDERNSRVSCSL